MSNTKVALLAALLVLLSALINPWLSLAIALAALLWLGFRQVKIAKRASTTQIINPDQVAEKSKNIKAVYEAARARGRITNDDVEHMLGVSNATAERYLNELERDGRLEQHGETGKGVFYTPH